MGLRRRARAPRDSPRAQEPQRCSPPARAVGCSRVAPAAAAAAGACLVLVLLLTASAQTTLAGGAVSLPTGAPYDDSHSEGAMRELWVNPAAGNDARDGLTRSTAKRTLTAAWDLIPTAQTLTGVAPLQGVRIRITPGTLAQAASAPEGAWAAAGARCCCGIPPATAAAVGS